MQNWNYKRLNNVQKGSFAEAYTKMLFTLAGFEVYQTEYDDRGIDYIVKLPDKGYLEVQVKATDKRSNPFIKEEKFKDTPDFLFCSVRLIDQEPPIVHLFQGDEWLQNRRFLNHNRGGGKGGGYYEIRYAKKYEQDLRNFDFHRTVERLLA